MRQRSLVFDEYGMRTLTNILKLYALLHTQTAMAAKPGKWTQVARVGGMAAINYTNSVVRHYKVVSW